MTNQTVEATSPGAFRLIVWLLAAAAFINYVDRGNLATAAPLIRDELGLSNSQMGILLSAFFWSYAVLQPVGGWLAQRFGVRVVLATGVMVWSVATMLTGMVSAFNVLFGLRILLGAGESVAYPCFSALLAVRAMEHERGRANGLIAAGQALGPTFGTLLGGLFMAHFGWRAAFVLLGLISLSWLPPWHLVSRDDARRQAPRHRPLRYAELLKRRSLWGASVGQFCSTYAYYFVLSWLPIFLVKAQGFSIEEMALIGAGVYAVHAGSSAAVGWVSDHLILNGASPSRLRKLQLVAGLVGVTVLMAACAHAGPTLCIALLLGSAALFGTQTPNFFLLSQTLGGPRAAGQWMGIQNLIGNLSGIAAPLATGFIVDYTGTFTWAFVIAAGVALVGAFAFGVLIRRIEPVEWDEEAQLCGIDIGELRTDPKPPIAR